MRIRNERTAARWDAIYSNFVVYAIITIGLLAPIPLMWVYGEHDLLAIVAMVVYTRIAWAAFMGLIVRGDWY